MYKMTFGKHKGKPLDKVPKGYLYYLYKTGIRLDADLAVYINDNIEDIRPKS